MLEIRVRVLEDNADTYEAMKDFLHIKLCDTKGNQDELKNLAHTEISDFSATYYAGSTIITNEMLNTWGITIDQLHKDALAADRKRKPLFCTMESIVCYAEDGTEPENLLNSKNITFIHPMYCLTNDAKENGASMLLQADVMKQISRMLGGSFYILPSSIHEVLIIPEDMALDVSALSQMVKDINETEVAPEEFLSNEVQFYDADTGMIENAEKREAGLNAAAISIAIG